MKTISRKAAVMALALGAVVNLANAATGNIILSNPNIMVKSATIAGATKQIAVYTFTLPAYSGDASTINYVKGNCWAADSWTATSSPVHNYACFYSDLSTVEGRAHYTMMLSAKENGNYLKFLIDDAVPSKSSVIAATTASGLWVSWAGHKITWVELF